LRELARKKTARVDIACPGFVSDCLETLEEIAIEARGEFITHGGGALHFIPCLNERPDWIAALTDLVQQNLLGWHRDTAPQSLEQSRQLAMRLGAKT
jgi:ferrochelatase